MLKAQLHENVGAGVASNPCEAFFERSSDFIFLVSHVCRCQNSSIRYIFNRAKACPYRNAYPPEASHAGYPLKSNPFKVTDPILS